MENQEYSLYKLKASIEEVNKRYHTKVEWIFEDCNKTFCEDVRREVCTDIINLRKNCDCQFVKFEHPDDFRLKLKVHEVAIKDRGTELDLFISSVKFIPLKIAVTTVVGGIASTRLETYYNLPGWHLLRTIRVNKKKLNIVLDLKIDRNFHLIRLTQIKEIQKGSVLQLSRDMEQLVYDGSFSDVTLLSVDGTPFKAHRAILASRSQMFRAMFQHDQNNSITTAYTDDVLREVLLYIYSGRSPNIMEMALELFVAADYYQLAGLKKMCVATLRNTITPDNAVGTLELAERFSITELCYETIKFIKSNGDLIVETDSWKNIESIELMKTLFKIAYLPV